MFVGDEALYCVVIADGHVSGAGQGQGVGGKVVGFPCSEVRRRLIV